MSGIDGVFDSLKIAFKYLESKWKPLFTQILKVYICMFGLGVVAVILLAVLGYITLASLSAIPITVILLAIISLILLIFLLLITALNSVIYNQIDAIAGNKKISIVETAKANLVPVSKYFIVVLLIQVILLLPFIIIAWPTISVLPGLFSSTPTGYSNVLFSLLGLIWVIIAAFLVLIILKFIIQFAFFELVLGKRSVISSLKQSLLLVKQNFIPVIIFDFILCVLIITISSLFSLVELPFRFITVFVPILAIPIATAFIYWSSQDDCNNCSFNIPALFFLEKTKYQKIN